MKKIVVPNQEESSGQQLKDCDTKYYYGIEFYNKHSGNEKAFIARKGYYHGPYALYATKNITNGNFYKTGFSLKELLKDYLQLPCNIYQFDSDKELFKWLGED